MKYRIPFRCPLLTCVLFVNAMAFAQSQERGSSGNDEDQTILHFRAMGMNHIVENIGFFQDGEFTRFSASRSRPTEWMEFRGEGEIYFYRAEDIANWNVMKDEDGSQEMPKPVAHFSPRQSGRWLLIFVRDPAEGGQYRLVPVPDQAEDMKEGIRFYNFTKRELAIHVTDEIIRILPREWKHMTPPPGQNSAMEMRIAESDGTGWELVSSTVFGHRPNALITFYIFNVDGRIVFKRFLDALEPRDS